MKMNFALSGEAIQCTLHGESTYFFQWQNVSGHYARCYISKHMYDNLFHDILLNGTFTTEDDIYTLSFGPEYVTTTKEQSLFINITQSDYQRALRDYKTFES